MATACIPVVSWCLCIDQINNGALKLGPGAASLLSAQRGKVGAPLRDSFIRHAFVLSTPLPARGLLMNASTWRYGRNNTSRVLGCFAGNRSHAPPPPHALGCGGRWVGGGSDLHTASCDLFSAPLRCSASRSTEAFSGHRSCELSQVLLRCQLVPPRCPGRLQIHHPASYAPPPPPPLLLWHPGEGWGWMGQREIGG